MDPHRRPDNHEARIFVIDDEPANVLLLVKMLSRAGYSAVHSTTNPMELPNLLQHGWPDLVLLDLNMPEMNGFDVMDYLDDLNEAATFLPVLVLTADANTETRDRALTSGALDFLTKPFDRTEVLLRIGNLLHTRRLTVELEQANAHLEDRVRQRTAQLEIAQAETVDRLALAAEFRDDQTGEHIRRVGKLSRQLAHALGLPEDQAQLIGLAAPLHDLGKIRVPDDVLLKPGPLTLEEFDIIKTHTSTGHELLRDSESPVLQVASVMALYHHEHWDGGGYSGVVGEDIPLVARIVSVADVYDALTHERCYKRAWASVDAVAEIRAGAGTQFDPQVVEAFLDVISPEPTVADPASC